MTSDRKTCEDGFVMTRQPVFDRRLQPWGTAMCFAQSAAEEPLFGDETTASILLEAYLPQRNPVREPTIVYFPAPAILDGMPRLLWPQDLLVEVDGTAGGTPRLTEAVAEMKKAGYGIAVNGFHNNGIESALLRLADVIIVDAAQAGGEGVRLDLPDLVKAAQQTGAKALVSGLDDWETMLHAREANADMFQGFFFNRMNLRPSTKSITASQLSRLRLLECMAKPDPDFKTLVRVVEADAALVYRLLVFINSAGFGLGRKVDSIQQAVVLAGWKPLQKWLEIILLSDLSPTPRHQELCYYAAQRAGFLRRVAKAAGKDGLVPGLSLLGLLSYLEAILEMPPVQALADVPLADDIRLALCGRRSPFSPWLALVRAMEKAEWDAATRLGQSIKLCMADLSRCYRESFVEADSLFRAMSSPVPAAA
ncbi:MAG: HDOD domain-containing protein [Humidesulfovibrio sp.]|nr:HDOD domain-containing protein [Humidesulfovibrio sp.]